MESRLVIAPQNWTVLKEQATILVKSGLLPTGIDTPEKAIAIAMKGQEMGIPPMQAFSHISIVQGKPCISAELMMSQIYKHCPKAVVNIVENTTEVAKIEAKRPGGKFATFSFSKDDAITAGLSGKGVWKQYPKVMLLWRTISQMARTMFPDCIMGASYTPEELGAEVNEEGEIIHINPNPVAEQTSLPTATPQKNDRSAIAKASFPATEIYTGTTEQQEKIKRHCEKEGVADKYWAAIDGKLQGKVFTKIAVGAAIREALGGN